MSSMYEEMIDNMQTTEQGNDDVDFNDNDGLAEPTVQSSSDIEAMLAELQSRRDSLTSEAEEKEQKKAEKRKTKLEEAKKKFHRKVLSKHIETIPSHTRTYRNEPKNGSRIGEECSMDVIGGEALVYLAKDQPNAPTISANATEAKGGRKLSIHEEGQDGNYDLMEMHDRKQKTREELREDCTAIQKRIDNITLWN